MKSKPLLWAGVAAPILYCETVVLGGALRSGYSHVGQPVSDLIAAGAPHKALLDALFAFYNLLVFAFGVGVFRLVRRPGPLPDQALGRAGAGMLLAESAFGLATLLFPEDPPGAALSIRGTLHIALAGLSSLATMLAMGLVGGWLGHQPHGRGSSQYSFWSLGWVLLTGGLAVVAVARHLPGGGLLERLTIGGFLQWMLLIALRLLAANEQPEPIDRALASRAPA